MTSRTVRKIIAAPIRPGRTQSRHSTPGRINCAHGLTRSTDMSEQGAPLIFRPSWLRRVIWIVPVILLGLGGCATRPINAPITEFSPNKGYQFQTRRHPIDHDNLIVLAFSGGGTRAAAFSYGVLEALRRTAIVGPEGTKRLLDQVDVITGVSGGSF